MPLNTEILKQRLRETFGSDSQETVGKKLNMTQGNVSKLLSGSQQPTLDTLYHIAESYDVSVDWLMGLSDKKKVQKVNQYTAYSTAVEALMDMRTCGAKIDAEGKDMVITVCDPVLKALTKKSLALSKADWDFYQDWKATRLSMFDDKEMLDGMVWRDGNVSFLASEATRETDWLEVYDTAKKKEEEYTEMMGDNPGPFGR